MIKNSFNLSGLTVVKDEFISFDLSVEEQVDELREDMFQAYKIDNDKTILDIGWYGEATELKGEFILFLVKNDDWDNPLVKISTNNLTILKYYINSVIQFLNDKNADGSPTGASRDKFNG
jgi:hypothetical protein